jgi:hypothetical protein
MARISARPLRPNAPARTLQARLELAERRLADHDRALAIQLTRIAELQADLDGVRTAWLHIKPPPNGTASVGRRAVVARSGTAG